jgi:CRP/FNR family transcriptional regulator
MDEDKDMLNGANLEVKAPALRPVYELHRASEPAVRRATSCSLCPARAICFGGNEPQNSDEGIDSIVHTRRRVFRGEHLYYAGDAFKSLYSFRSGFFKSYVDTPDGQSQVVGFPMAGDVVGLDGIASDRYERNVVALDDGEACVIPYANIQGLAARSPGIQHQLHKIMSLEIVQEQVIVAMLGRMRAEPRVAKFLLGLSQRFAARGYSHTKFRLRMTREEIGSYLGLKLETVSRALSLFQKNGLIQLNFRSIEITDLRGLDGVTKGI